MVAAWWWRGGGVVVAWWWRGGGVVVAWWWRGGGVVVQSVLAAHRGDGDGNRSGGSSPNNTLA